MALTALAWDAAAVAGAMAAAVPDAAVVVALASPEDAPARAVAAAPSAAPVAAFLALPGLWAAAVASEETAGTADLRRRSARETSPRAEAAAAGGRAGAKAPHLQLQQLLTGSQGCCRRSAATSRPMATTWRPRRGRSPHREASVCQRQARRRPRTWLRPRRRAQDFWRWASRRRCRRSAVVWAVWVSRPPPCRG